MLLAKVVGTLVATRKEAELEGLTFLIVKACDFDGRVERYPGLYVVDGALIEGATGLANPSFTIAALAERSMDHILAEDHLRDHTP